LKRWNRHWERLKEKSMVKLNTIYDRMNLSSFI
jgi:hypothetical protein